MNSHSSDSGQTIGYLGPVGTFTLAALRQLRPDGPEEPFANVGAALAAVREGRIESAVVPMENSVEGGVSATMDALADGSALTIVAEAVVPVSFVLAARPGTTLSQVKRISTHSHALAQCRGWLAANLPDAGYVPGLSTASAAQLLAPGAQDPGYQAALCAPIAAEHYGLQALAEDVGDNPNAVTRFVRVRRPQAPPAPTGADKTTLVAYQPADYPGGLLELLEQFATRGINLVRIESRPTGDALGQYCFSIDAEGHVNEPRMAEALMGLHRFCSKVLFLGSYPSADRAAVVVPSRAGEAAFTRAAAWVADLRAGRL